MIAVIDPRLQPRSSKGTRDDGDAFDQLQVEWETQLADGMDLEAQVSLANSFHASVSAVLSF